MLPLLCPFGHSGGALCEGSLHVSKLRRAVWLAREDLREHPATPDRTRRCGAQRFTKHPEIRCKTEGARTHAWWEGDVRCRARICPVCWVGRRAKLAQEITHVAEHWQRTYPKAPAQLATLTIRHSERDPDSIVLGVRKCWRKMLGGRAWLRYKKERGAELIAAEEITLGPHGWHPHMHVLLLSKHPQSTEHFDVDKMIWCDRWRGIVGRELGASHVPDYTHGVDLRPCRCEDYLSKLGFELSDAAEVKSRSAFDILREGEIDKYLALQRLRRGHKDVTWSRGLKSIRESMPLREPGNLLYQPNATDWDRAREHKQLLAALEVAEKKGAEAAGRRMWRSNYRDSARHVALGTYDPEAEAIAALRTDPSHGGISGPGGDQESAGGETPRTAPGASSDAARDSSGA